MSILVSFIIPHKGRIDLLEKTLQSILQQDFDLGQIEIILVTQEPRLDLQEITSKVDLKIIYPPTQKTPALAGDVRQKAWRILPDGFARALWRKCVGRILRSPADKDGAKGDSLLRRIPPTSKVPRAMPGGLHCSPEETIAALRNRGAEMASGEHLAFIDADILLSSNWIETVLEELTVKSNRVLVSTKAACSGSPSPVEKIWLKINNEKINKAVDSLHARNLFLSKETFKKTGGFPEELTTCEDTHFTNKLSQMGEIYITPRAFHEHLGEDKTYSELFSKEIWRSQSNLHSIRGRKMPLKELPSITIPFWEAFWGVGFILAILLQRPFLILLTLFAFLGPILLYSARIYLRNPGELSLFDILRFYLVYFVARMIGSVKGLFFLRRV